MIAESLPVGPRQRAVAKAEVEVTVAQEKFDLAIDSREWADAVEALRELRAARATVDQILITWILDLPGAEEFFHPKGSAGDTG